MPATATPTSTVAFMEALRTAKDLRSEDGENPEYDRALVELLARLYSTPHTGDLTDFITTYLLVIP